MAKSLSKTGITTGNTVRAFHVTQSIDAFTGTEAYDIVLSGSLEVTGSITGQPGIINNLTSSYAITASHALNAGGGTPGGSDTQVQFNDGGSFGGDSGFTFNKTTNSITAITNITASGNISASGDMTCNNLTAIGITTLNRIRGNNPSVPSHVVFDHTISAPGITSSGDSLFGDSTTDTHTFTGHITSSGNISSSGQGIFGGVLVTDSNIDANGTTKYRVDGYSVLQNSATTLKIAGNNYWETITYGNEITDHHSFTGNITASGDISASGIINASRYDINGQRIIAQDTFGSVDSISINPSSSPVVKFGASQGIVLTSDVTGSARTISGSSLIGEATNIYRPITTLSTNPFTASDATAGAYYRAGGNITCSIFVTASVSCTTGVEFEFIQTSSAGYVLFETGSGVTLNSKNGNLKLAGQFSAATLKYVGNNEWDLIGDLG